MCFEPRSNSASYKLTFHTSKKLIRNSATIAIFLKGVKFKFKWPREKKFHKKRRYTCNAGDLGSIPGLGRSPREGKGFPLQYSGLEKSTGSHSVGHDWATFTSQSSTEVTGHKSTGNSERRTRFADLESDLAHSQVAGNKPKGLMIQYFCLKATVVLLNNYFLPSWNIRVYTVPRSRLFPPNNCPPLLGVSGLVMAWNSPQQNPWTDWHTSLSNPPTQWLNLLWARTFFISKLALSSCVIVHVAYLQM